jgi:hypothetical protein
VVPLSKRTAVPGSPFGFPVDGTGCERSNLRKRRFRVPGSQGNLARQGTCVVLNGWCIEACVGGVTGWAIGAGGDPRKPIRDCPADGGARESPRPSDVRSSQRGGSGRQRRSGMSGARSRTACLPSERRLRDVSQRRRWQPLNSATALRSGFHRRLYQREMRDRGSADDLLPGR